MVCMDSCKTSFDPFWPPRTGDIVLLELLAKTEDGKVFIDTREAGNRLANQVGTTNKFITEGLDQVKHWANR